MPIWEQRGLSGAREARSIALEVARRLSSAEHTYPDEPCDSSLAGGEAGLALLFGYLDQCFPNDGWDSAAHAAMLRIGASIAKSASLPIGLFGGLSGIAYASWYLSHGDTRYLRARTAIDDVLLPRATAVAHSFADRYGMAVEDFDIVSGLSGVAAYLLCRTSDDRIYATLKAVISSLVEIVERDMSPPAWFTPANLISGKAMIGKYPQGNLNCGVAHGAPGMLSVLALAYRQDAAVPGLRSAIERLARWLMEQRRMERWGASWPASVGVSASDLSTPAPVGWCYGNPGVARALWLAGEALDDPALIEGAMEALRSAHRHPVSRRAEFSPTFCHGAAGLLQITMRFAHETNSPEFSDAADLVLQRLLSLFADDALYGYRDYEPDSGPADRRGLLDGAAGVALVLCATATNQDPAWDRVFVLS